MKCFIKRWHISDGLWSAASTISEDGQGVKHEPGNVFKDGLIFKSKFESYPFLVIDMGLHYYISHVQVKFGTENDLHDDDQNVYYDILIGTTNFDSVFPSKTSCTFQEKLMSFTGTVLLLKIRTVEEFF